MKVDPIKKKLAALLRLSKDAAATPAEAANAAARAQEIADRHRIDLGSVEAALRTEHVSSTHFKMANSAPWRKKLWHLVARANGCRGIGNYGSLHVFGHPADVEVVGYLGVYLERLLDKQSSAAYKNYSATNWRYVGARMFKQSWCLGAVEAIKERYAEMHQSQTDALVDPDHKDMGPGLVPVDQINAAIKLAYPRLGSVRGATYVPSVFNEGRSSGAGVGIRRAITTPTRLLGGG